nr:lysoplasmalogenase [Bacillus rubiinfantis]
MKQHLLPISILFMSLLYIFVIPSQPIGLKIFFKLIPMILIIRYAYLSISQNKTPFSRLILIGLIFSMCGDGLIYWFVAGLSSFLLGHIFYGFGFVKKWNFSMIRFLTVFLIATYAFLIGSAIITALQQHGNTDLIIPVIAYMVVISSMAWLAIMTGNKWASAGSILFVISDSILAWNMFVSPITYSDTLIMVTYYTAQFLIAHSLRSFHSVSTRTSMNTFTY